MFDIDKVLNSVHSVVDTVLDKVDVVKASAIVLLNSTDAWIEAVNNNVDVQTAGKIVGEATLLLIKKTAGREEVSTEDTYERWWSDLQSVLDDDKPFKSFYDGI